MNIDRLPARLQLPALPASLTVLSEGTIETAHRMQSGLGSGAEGVVLAVMPSICPQAPPGAQALTEQLLDNVAWVVIMLFGLAVMVSIGMVIAGRVFKIPGLTISGVIGLVVVALAAIGWFVAPEMISGILGDGCT